MGTKQRIMILEDNVMMRSLLQTLLELENFQVVCPDFPIVDTIKIIKDIDPAVILMDINLPNLNGITLMGEIRSSQELDHVKVIMCSGSDKKTESLNAGARAYLMKPYMPDELITLVKKIINE